MVYEYVIINLNMLMVSSSTIYPILYDLSINSFDHLKFIRNPSNMLYKILMILLSLSDSFHMLFDAINHTSSYSTSCFYVVIRPLLLIYNLEMLYPFHYLIYQIIVLCGLLHVLVHQHTLQSLIHIDMLHYDNSHQIIY